MCAGMVKIGTPGGDCPCKATKNIPKPTDDDDQDEDDDDDDDHNSEEDEVEAMRKEEEEEAELQRRQYVRQRILATGKLSSG